MNYFRPTPSTRADRTISSTRLIERPYRSDKTSFTRLEFRVPEQLLVRLLLATEVEISFVIIRFCFTRLCA